MNTATNSYATDGKCHNANRMFIGTSHFVSYGHAVDYYHSQGQGSFATVRRKIVEGEIHIGAPELKPGQSLRVIDRGTRYAIEE